MRGALLLLVLAAPAYADNPHPEGQYSGVIPGEAPPREPAARPGRPRRPPPRGTLTWVGFSARDGGAEVFFQSVAPFEVAQWIEGRALVVHLGLKHLGHNTWRRIDTRFFDNPLAGIVARAVGAARATKTRPAHGAGIEARITFKNARDVREGAVRTATEADGMFYAYVRFPEGTEPAPASTPPATIQEPETEAPPPASNPPKR
ncbi:MAG TPA: hypothetical protein VFT22_28210 [Kofleriaceae bacterium]|nr:hypothetical protein [Kofleriaceae bacterium]